MSTAVAEEKSDESAAVAGSGTVVTSDTESLSPKVGRLVEDLIALNMLEVKELTKELQKRLGIEDGAMNMGMAMQMQMPAGGAGQGAEVKEEVPEKTEFDVKLEGFDAAKKIAVIKAVRGLVSGLGLKEAKALVESAPKVIREAVPKDEAEKIRDQLNDIGAKAVLA